MNSESNSEESALRERIAAHSNDPADYLELAVLLHQRGEYADALATLNQALTLDLGPDKRERVLHEKALFLSQVGGHESEVLALANESLALLGENNQEPDLVLRAVDASGLRVYALLNTDQSRAREIAFKALKSIDSLLQDHADADPAILFRAGYAAAWLHSMLGQTDKAIECLERALAQPTEGIKQPDDLRRLDDAHLRMGRLLRTAGRAAEAKRTCEETQRYLASRQGPRNWVAEKELSFDLASLYCELGEHAKAAEMWRQLLEETDETDPLYWNCRQWLGVSLMHLKEFNESRKHLEAVIRDSGLEDTRNTAEQWLFLLRYNLALRDYERRDCGAAIRELESLRSEPIEEEDLKATIVLLLGHAYYSCRQFSQAQACYEELANSATAPQYQRDTAASGLRQLRDRGFETEVPRQVN
jgi:tetratricopeptide (TPR) repeat protein